MTISVFFHLFPLFLSLLTRFSIPIASSSASSLPYHYRNASSSLPLLPSPCLFCAKNRIDNVANLSGICATPQGSWQYQQNQSLCSPSLLYSKKWGPPLGSSSIQSIHDDAHKWHRNACKRQKRNYGDICAMSMDMDAEPISSMAKYDASGIDSLEVSCQLKEIFDMGEVDHHHQNSLEERELVERLMRIQSSIPPASRKLLQHYIEGSEASIESVISSLPISAEERQWLEAERNTIRVFQEASPSVVSIINIRMAKDPTMEIPREIPRGSGSGFIWDKDGHIVTNFHVVMSGDIARVTLADLSTWDGKIVAVSKTKDLAVIKIQAPPSKLKPLSVGTSRGLQVGQHVLAIGYPFGLERTLTSGIISGLGRGIRGICGGTIRGVIQTDASINPGNSGGPLLDSQGYLIGVNTAIYSPSGASAGVGFAIPVDTVRRVVNQIIRNGRVVRPGIGITCASNNQAKQLGVVGVLVLDVRPNGAAARAGIRGTERDPFSNLVLGDVIVAIDGQTINTFEDLLAAFEDHQAGETIVVTVKRGDTMKDFYVTLETVNE